MRRHADSRVIGGGVASKDRGYAFIDRFLSLAPRQSVPRPSEAGEPAGATRQDSGRRGLSPPPSRPLAATPATAHRRTCVENPDLDPRSTRPAAESDVSPRG